MSFRTIEISHPAEIHIKNNQLQIEQENGTVLIPLEDISLIFCIGPNIRISSMALSRMSEYKIVLTTLDEKYLPTATVIPYEGNARQSQLMHLQVNIGEKEKNELWKQIIYRKISNQSRALSILGLNGVEEVMAYAIDLQDENIDINEALAAKEYFSYFHPGLNRRVDDPVNSRLNYGYAVVRSAIVRSLVSVGFHPTFGIHHNNQLNPFNLADDLIEVWRPMVDLVTYDNIGSNLFLTKNERYEIAHVLHNACMIGEQKMTILSAIDVTCESLKNCFLDEDTSLIKLPTVLTIESMELINE